LMSMKTPAGWQNTAVHLGHQRGGDLDAGNTPHIDGSDKTRQVARNAASQRDQGGFAVHTESEQSAGDIQHRLNIF
jgi:hypothetical protein